MADEEAQLVELLRALLSVDNAVRGAAEQRFADLRKGHSSQLVGLLLKIVAQPHVDIPVREIAALLLRQCFAKIRDIDSAWSKLCLAPSQQEVLATLLVLLENEPSDRVRRKIGDCIQSLGNQLLEQDDLHTRPNNASSWPQLLPTLLRISTSEDSKVASPVRADALWTVKELTRSIWPVLLTNAGQTFDVLRRCLADSSSAVRTSAACLLCETAGAIEGKEETRILQPLLPDLLMVVEQLAQGGVEEVEHLRSLLQAFVSTTSASCELYSKELLASAVLPRFLTVAWSHSDDGVRRLALEALCSLAEARPKTVGRVAGCLDRIFEVCVRFLLELDEDFEAWSRIEESGADGEEQHDFGAEVVDRICGALRKSECLSQAMMSLQPAISKLLQDADWRRLVAGLVLLRQIVEYLEDESTVRQVISAARSHLFQDNARVRVAAWGCLQQLAQDHAEVVASEDEAKLLLPLFLVGFEDSRPRVVVSCMVAFHHYGENVERETLEPFAPALMEMLAAKVGTGTAIVRREAITCLAVMASQLQDAFAPYYMGLMPVLKQVVAESCHKVEERVLLGKAFECISLLANAVGRDIFRPDAETIMEAMVLAAQGCGAGSDDPVQEYMMSAAERICSTLREDFLKYLPALLPWVLAKLSRAPREYDEAAARSLEAEDDLSFAVVAAGDGEARILAMTSSELEDLKRAVECIHTFVVRLERQFAPYVGETAKALLPVFEFTMSEEIREVAFEVWGQLCHGAREGGQEQLLAELVGEFLRRMVPKLEPDVVDAEAVRTRADGIVACLREAGPGVLGVGQAGHLCVLARKLVDDSITRRGSGLSGKTRPDRTGGESDDDESDSDEEAEEQILRQSAMNCVTAVMTHHPEAFVSEGLQIHVPLVQSLISPERPNEDRRLGLYGVSSLLEHLGDRVMQSWAMFLPRVMEDITAPAAEVRSAACYAASFAARSACFAQHAAPVSARLAELIVRSRAAGGKKSQKPSQLAADNALSALLETLMHHESVIPASQVPELWSVWLEGLPCREDEAEGIRNHGVLLQLAQRQKREVVGENYARVPRVLSTLVDVYRTPMADDLTCYGIGKMLLGLGEARLELCSASLSERQRKKLLRILRDAQKGVAS